jgi:dolichol-phosphate mannosyltransferase
VVSYKYKIAVVIPSYKVKAHILAVINSIGLECERIFVVDDKCPQNSGNFVAEHCTDTRVVVIFNEQNQGVGGAVMAGYKAAIEDGAEIIVKIDGDGQMDPELLPFFAEPLLLGEADYSKGNRFFDLESLHSMPKIRLFGNSVLSFMTKFSSGYWNLFDPTNGYTAIHASVANRLPFDKISRRYFFETDMLFRLNTLRAVAVDIPMDAKYEDEVSSLKISDIMGDFVFKHLRNTWKRIFYNYYLRDMSLASVELPVGLLLVLFSVFYGGYHWYVSSSTNISAPTGIVVLSAITLVMGLQLLLAFIGYDIASVPVRPIQKKSIK